MVSILAAAIPKYMQKELEANHSIRKQIKEMAEEGLFIYAECGGLMYLTDGIIDLDGKRHEMIGVFPAFARMLPKEVSRLCYS